MVARAMLLVAVFLQQRGTEGLRVRPRQDRERSEPFGMGSGDAPRDLPAPVVADLVEALALVAGRRRDLDRVADQPVEA